MKQTVISKAIEYYQNAEYIGEKTTNGVKHKIWKYFDTPEFAAPTAGVHAGTNCHVLGSKFLACEFHHNTGFHVAKQYKINGYTVQGEKWLSLGQWAVAQGLCTPDEFKAQTGGKYEESQQYDGIGVIRLTSVKDSSGNEYGELPENFLPYVMDYDFFINNNISFQYLPGWYQNQGTMYAAGLIFNNSYGTSFTTSVYNTSYKIDQTLKDTINSKAIGTQVPIYVGDSGHPIYVDINGKWVILTQFEYTASGPYASYIRHMPYLKAYAESIGSRIKILDGSNI